MNGIVTALSGALCSDIVVEDDKDNLRFNAGRMLGATALALTAGVGAYLITGAAKSKTKTAGSAEGASA